MFSMTYDNGSKPVCRGNSNFSVQKMLFHALMLNATHIRGAVKKFCNSVWYVKCRQIIVITNVTYPYEFCCVKICFERFY